ncbi:MAG: PAS domain S-box protein, partial [Longimonas sp.]|uniref:PAS domain S-box protein n=1 Tax=Longimonas sp. TaxID=2039626 RepID=UPI003974FD40
MVALTDVLSWIDLLNLAGASSGPLGALAAVWGRAPSSTDAAEPLPSQVPTGLLNYVNGAVLVIDSTYRVEHFNQQVHPFFPDQQIEVGAVLPRALADDLPESGKTVTVVWPLASDITVQMHVQAVRGPGGILRVLTLRDVSEAVQYEAALRKTDRLLRSILDTDVAAIAVVNGQGNVTYANTQAEALLGLEPTERGAAAAPHDTGAWRYKQLGWRMEPLSDKATRTPLRDVLDTHEPIRDLQCKVTWPNGTCRYLSLNAALLPAEVERPPQVVFAMKDITRRYAVYQELKAQVQRYEATRNAMPAFFYMTDHAGHERTWNDTLRQKTGYADDELAGSALPHLFHPD